MEGQGSATITPIYSSLNNTIRVNDSKKKITISSPSLKVLAMPNKSILFLITCYVIFSFSLKLFVGPFSSKLSVYLINENQ